MAKINRNYFIKRKPKETIDYEKTYWQEVVDPDGRERNLLRERKRYLKDIKQELKFLNSLPAGRILDIGCGLGYLLSGVNKRWKKHGLEISRFAAKKASKWGEIYVGELKSAKYPQKYFDVVVMHHVIEHLKDPVGAIAEVYRILKNKGILLLGTPDFDSGCARRFGKNYRLLKDPTHISLFSNDSIKRLLRDYGFVINKVEYPFFETRHFTAENLMRLFDTSKVSPPFYGNYMTFYCYKPKKQKKG